MSSAEWYYAQDGRQYGPLPYDVLEHLVESGRIRPADLVWCAGVANWQPASRLSDMANEAVLAEGRTKPPPLPTQAESATQSRIPPPLPKAHPVKVTDQAPRRRDRPEAHRARQKSKTPMLLALVAGSVAVLVCGACMVSFLRFNNENEEQVRKPIAEGDALWDAGDKANAVKKYEVVLGDKFDLYGKKADRPRIYGRLIEYAHQQEKAEEVSHLVTKADQKGITPTINDPAVQRAVSEVRARAAAKKAEQDRLANRTPVEKLREANANEIVRAVQLQREFAANEVAANESRKGKVWIIEGMVFSVESGGALSNHQLLLCDTQETLAVICHLSTTSAKSPDLRSLNRGKWVRVIGTCRGKDVIGRVEMRDCDFLPLDLPSLP